MQGNVATSREVLLGKQDLPTAWIESVERNDSGQVWLEFEELGITVKTGGCFLPGQLVADLETLLPDLHVAVGSADVTGKAKRGRSLFFVGSCWELLADLQR